MLQTSQWKNRPRPPTRQMPHPSQWYWLRSSSSNKLQTRHVYWNKNDKFLVIKWLHKLFWLVLPCQIWRRTSRRLPGLSVAYHILCRSIRSPISGWSSEIHFHHGNIGTCRIYYSMVSGKIKKVIYVNLLN